MNEHDLDVLKYKVCCPVCDSEKCVKGSDKCDAEIWKREQLRRRRMSRYVDLDGNTWDGEPIISKIQEVKTKHGYMSAITTGWLFSEGVPYLDIEKHDAKVRADERAKVIDHIEKYMITSICSSCDQEACEGGMVASIQECETIQFLKDAIHECV